LEKGRSNNKDRNWLTVEKNRILSCPAFLKFCSNYKDKITRTELLEVFRIDDYIVGEIRKKKIQRIHNLFSDDPDIGAAINYFYERI